MLVRTDFGKILASGSGVWLQFRLIFRLIMMMMMDRPPNGNFANACCGPNISGQNLENLSEHNYPNFASGNFHLL
jgi:hypothetical protein